MTSPHNLGVHGSSQAALEAVGAEFINEGLFRAREKTIQVLEEIRAQLREGMTEGEARTLALQIFKSHGVTKHWHQPGIRFGVGTRLNFNDPLQPDYRLKAGDAYYLDLGPVWPDAELGLEYEGDYGDSFSLGENTGLANCAATARKIFTEARAAWKEKRLTGAELYTFMRSRAKELGYEMIDGVEGHRVSEFPHQKHTKERLSIIPFVPSPTIWVLELQLLDPSGEFGAFYEDLL